jgi:integrase
LIVPTRGQKWPVDAHEKMIERAVDLLDWEYQEAVDRGDVSLPPRWLWKSHYLRHVYGSWSLASQDHGGLGWSITLVQESMGHVSERTTREIYRHVILPEREAARTASIAWPGL